ncbi:MAG: helix-turn-helix transcriptional regulator [Candidatus Methanofastidiosia archaeon]
MHYKMTVSFVISILIGILVFWITKPKEIFEMDVFGILEKVLNEDETLILKLVRENEGITQDSLRYRCGFSKSKVSVMVQNLERKGIFLREKFGRTYKIHLSESLK